MAVCYQEIKDTEDTLKLQKDIDQLGCWARKWGMRFQPVKCNMMQPEDHWSCIARPSAEDMLKSAVIEEKKFKHSPRGRQPIRAKILMSTGRPHHYGHLLQVSKKSLRSDFIQLFS